MENENKQHSCCFFGHRKLDETPKLTERLTQAVETNHGKGNNRFFTKYIVNFINR